MSQKPFRIQTTQSQVNGYLLFVPIISDLSVNATMMGNKSSVGQGRKGIAIKYSLLWLSRNTIIVFIVIRFSTDYYNRNYI